MKVTVLGTGTWGTALAQLLCDNDNDVIMYGIVESEVEDIELHHQNSKYFGPDILLPATLRATMSLQEAMEGTEMVVVAVPTQAVRSVLKQAKPYFKNKPYVVSVAKGFDPETGKRMSEVVREVLPSDIRQEVVSLIGPGHAEEVILRWLTCVTSTSIDIKAATKVQKTFSNDYFRVYTQTDEVGAEFGVALKNAIALASGMCEGIGLGDNARAALVTRGLAEIVRFGVHFGGNLNTYLGLTGLGDLMVTCNSCHSRNFMAGEEIGKANSAVDFLKNNKKTVEGVRTAKVVYELAKEHNIDMPIIEAVYKVLYEHALPKETLSEMMKRSLKSE